MVLTALQLTCFAAHLLCSSPAVQPALRACMCFRALLGRCEGESCPTIACQLGQACSWTCSIHMCIWCISTHLKGLMSPWQPGKETYASRHGLCEPLHRTNGVPTLKGVFLATYIFVVCKLHLVVWIRNSVSAYEPVLLTCRWRTSMPMKKPSITPTTWTSEGGRTPCTPA